MVEFCPECSGLLKKIKMNDKSLLICRCGYQKEIENREEKIKIEIQKKKDALKKEVIVVTSDSKISVLPRVAKICPKCENREAEAWQEQTRGADEPSTSFFRCLKCKYTWREY